MLVRMLGLCQVVVVMVVGMESLQVVSLLDVLHLMLNKRVGGVVASRWRGGMVHGLPFVVFVLLQLDRSGSLTVILMVVFVVLQLERRDDLVCAYPTLEKMARHWFYSSGTNPNAESFVHSRARF
jgi:hypothetical protein